MQEEDSEREWTPVKLEAFSEQMAHALGSRLSALVLYGSAARASDAPSQRAAMNTLLIVAGDAVSDDLFVQLSGPVRSWVASGHPPPIIMTEREWRDSTDAFPIEYDDIRAGHRVLAGRDPWHGIAVQRADVRRQLEHELMGKLVHLRQAYAANWNRPKRLADVIRETRAGFLTMLRAVLRLAGRTPPADAGALVRDAGALIGFGADGLAEPAAYLDAVTRTAQYVNRMERNVS